MSATLTLIVAGVNGCIFSLLYLQQRDITAVATPVVVLLIQLCGLLQNTLPGAAWAPAVQWALSAPLLTWLMSEVLNNSSMSSPTVPVSIGGESTAQLTTVSSTGSGNESNNATPQVDAARSQVFCFIRPNQLHHLRLLAIEEVTALVAISLPCVFNHSAAGLTFALVVAAPMGWELWSAWILRLPWTEQQLQQPSQPLPPAPLEARPLPPLPQVHLLCGLYGSSKALQAAVALLLAARLPGVLAGSGFGRVLWLFSSGVMLHVVPLCLAAYLALLRFALQLLMAVSQEAGWQRAVHTQCNVPLDEHLLADSGTPLGNGNASTHSTSAGGGTSVGIGNAGAGPNTSLFAMVQQRMLDIGELYRISEGPGSDRNSSMTSVNDDWQLQQLQQQLAQRGTTAAARWQRQSLLGPGSDVDSPPSPPQTSSWVHHSGVASRCVAATQTEPINADASSSQVSTPGEPLSPPTAGAAACTPSADSASSSAAALDSAALRPATVDGEVQTDDLPQALPAGVPYTDIADSQAGFWKGVVLALQEHSSDIAHDMKNPLNGVLALTQTVLQGTFGELPPVAMEQLGVVRSCAYHLLNMINQMSDMLRLLGGSKADMSLGRVMLGSHVEEVLLRMKPMVGTRLAVDYNPAALAHGVIADDSRVYQVLHVVLANAFKYTRKGTITISTGTSPDGGSMYVRIDDTGTGFTSDLLAKFTSPTPAAASDMGLGLALVRRLMRLFGGALRLGNRGEKGAGAWVELWFKLKESCPDLAEQPDRVPWPLPQENAATAGGPTSHKCGPAAAMRVHPPQQAAATARAGQHQLDPPPAPPAAAPSHPSDPKDPQGGKSASRAVAAAAAAAAASANCTRRRSLEESLAVARISADGALIKYKSGSNVPMEAAMAGGQSGNGGGGSKARSWLRTPSFAGEGQDGPIRLLVVDDDPVNLGILEDLLVSEGYEVLVATTGVEALEMFLTVDPPPKLVLLDVTLPDMTGHEVCLKMRSLCPGVPPPIIMISGKASTKDVIKGLQAGSSDYITKPFQPQEVLARVETQLRLFMGEVRQLQAVAERNMRLLSQILPQHLLNNLQMGNRVLVEKFPDVCVLYAGVVGFGNLVSHADTSECILALNRIFSNFDTLTDKHAVHKVDSVGDCYMAAIGHQHEDAALSGAAKVKGMLDFARDMLDVMQQVAYPETLGQMELRIGIHIGPVYAGVLGVKFPRYCFFGTTVRLAASLQQVALPMTIHVSEMVYQRVARSGLGGDTFLPFTSSSFTGLGIVRTHLLVTSHRDPSYLAHINVMDYLKSATGGNKGLQVVMPLLGSSLPVQMLPAPVVLEQAPAATWPASNGSAPTAPWVAVAAAPKAEALPPISSSGNVRDWIPSSSNGGSAAAPPPTVAPAAAPTVSTIYSSALYAPAAHSKPATDPSAAATSASSRMTWRAGSTAQHPQRPPAALPTSRGRARAGSGPGQQAAAYEAQPAVLGHRGLRNNDGGTVNSVHHSSSTHAFWGDVDGELLEQLGMRTTAAAAAIKMQSAPDPAASALLRQIRADMARQKGEAATAEAAAAAGSAVAADVPNGTSLAPGSSVQAGPNASVVVMHTAELGMVRRTLSTNRLMPAATAAAMAATADPARAHKQVASSRSASNHSSYSGEASVSHSAGHTMQHGQQQEPGAAPQLQLQQHQQRGEVLVQKSQLLLQQSLRSQAVAQGPLPASLPAHAEPQTWLAAEAFQGAPNAPLPPCCGPGTAMHPTDDPQEGASELEDLFNSIGLGHYAPRLLEQGLTLHDVACMDNATLKNCGLVTSRAREMVDQELRRWGLR